MAGDAADAGEARPPEPPTDARTLSGQPTVDRTLSGQPTAAPAGSDARTLSGQPTIDATLSGQATAAPAAADGRTRSGEPTAAPATTDGRAVSGQPTGAPAPPTGGAAPAVADLAPGSRFAGYLIEGRLGAGGMGVVYRARHAQLSNRAAALKVMRPEAAGGNFAARFLREANSAAAVNHPNVVQLYDFGEWQGVLYMAMEFVPGGDLAGAIKAQGRLGVARALAVLRDCARGLGAIHEAGLLHRDIKPHNIFLDARGRAKLGDLGLARAADAGDERVTLTGGVLGTPAYMSPEQAEGRDDLDIRSDIHALGATLYAMLTGRAPFAGSSPYVVVNQVLSAPRPRIAALVPDVPPAVEALAQAAMAIERDARQRDPLALLAAIDAADPGRSTAGAGATAAPALPAAIDGYAVEAALGQGGMGAVYRVRDRNTGLPLALKTIRLDLAAAAVLRPRFRQEYGLLQRLNHPAIVRVFGMGEDPEHGLYYTMELLAGASLHASRAATPPAPGEAVRWWRQIAAAILAAHDAGVLHRDLKPQNVVFRAPGQPVIVDFGLGGESDQGGRTLARGTRAWAPPEQGEGRTSHATDVYGLAALLAWLLTGALPGAARGRLAALLADAGAPRPLLAAALERGLAPLPARFLTVDELIHAVEQALAAAPLAESAAPAGAPAMADRMVARAEELLRAGDRVQAAQVCERVLHDDPGHAGAACCLLAARHDAGAFRAAARQHALLAGAPPDHPLWRRVSERLARCGDGPQLHGAPVPMAYCFPERELAAGNRVRELFEHKAGHLNPGDLGVLAIELLEADTPQLAVGFATGKGADGQQVRTLALRAPDLAVELRYRTQPSRRSWFGLGGGGHPPTLLTIACTGAPVLRLAFAHALASAAGARLGRNPAALCRGLEWTGLDLAAARADWELVRAPFGG